MYDRAKAFGLSPLTYNATEIILIQSFHSYLIAAEYKAAHDFLISLGTIVTVQRLVAITYNDL